MQPLMQYIEELGNGGRPLAGARRGDGNPADARMIPPRGPPSYVRIVASHATRAHGADAAVGAQPQATDLKKFKFASPALPLENCDASVRELKKNAAVICKKHRRWGRQGEV